VLSKIYIEEAFEIKDYEDFRKIDGSLRGTPPLGVHLQITMAMKMVLPNHLQITKKPR
jgi:hypothetical protein